MTSSPVPSKAKIEMDFYQALRHVYEGGKVTKLEWGSTEEYLLLRNNQLQLRKKDGTFHPLIVSDGDMAGKDYVVI